MGCLVILCFVLFWLTFLSAAYAVVQLLGLPPDLAIDIMSFAALVGYVIPYIVAHRVLNKLM